MVIAGDDAIRRRGVLRQPGGHIVEVVHRAQPILQRDEALAQACKGIRRACRRAEDLNGVTQALALHAQAVQVFACSEILLGQREVVTIFGNDYATPDGTCIRDYVHVEDLIDAHVTVMHALRPGEARTYNVGIGRGYSVREVIEACRKVTGVNFKEVVGARRAGDPPALFANPKKIREELGWSARHVDLDRIIGTAWRWKQNHPNGY